LSAPAPIVARLALETVGANAFEGRNPPGEQHVFGGLVVGQALRAAQATVADAARKPHSLHASFLRAGRTALAIRYDVESTRDGGAFSTRRVVASQADEPILVLTASFHPGEPGPAYETPPLPGPVPAPDGLAPGRYDGAAFDCRDVPVEPGADAPPHVRRMWLRARGQLPDDPDLHRWALAYASDHGPTRAVREPHADHPGVEQRHSVSLDHSVWFHGFERVDNWLLSELWPIATGQSRGLCIGTVRTAAGRLLATVAQEALLRLPG
jgi:acyl-CoA thioesterase-2